MRKSAVFMNIGRGETVKEDDLVLALKKGTIAEAVLDVFQIEPLPKENPLWLMLNVIVYPHSADSF